MNTNDFCFLFLFLCVCVYRDCLALYANSAKFECPSCFTVIHSDNIPDTSKHVYNDVFQSKIEPYLPINQKSNIKIKLMILNDLSAITNFVDQFDTDQASQQLAVIAGLSFGWQKTDPVIKAMQINAQKALIKSYIDIYRNQNKNEFLYFLNGAQPGSAGSTYGRDPNFAFYYKFDDETGGIDYFAFMAMRRKYSHFFSAVPQQLDDSCAKEFIFNVDTDL